MSSGTTNGGYSQPSVLRALATSSGPRSEEHTSELQSLRHLVCRLLLEKKKTHVNAMIAMTTAHFLLRTQEIRQLRTRLTKNSNIPAIMISSKTNAAESRTE